MKRAGNLWPAIIERGNLVRAFHQAARGKRRKMEVRRFAENLDENLERMREELEAGTFMTGRFHVFKVYDPKERTIHAVHFPERVFHHALMNLTGEIDELALQQRLTAQTAFALPVGSYGFRQRVFEESGRRPSGTNRLNRGGSWNNNANNCRAANRNNNIGFRTARSSDQEGGISL